MVSIHENQSMMFGYEFPLLKGDRGMLEIKI